MRRIDGRVWDHACASLPVGAMAKQLDGDVGLALTENQRAHRLGIAGRFFAILGCSWELVETLEGHGPGATFWYRRLP